MTQMTEQTQSLNAIHFPRGFPVDYVIFPREVQGCIVFDDSAFGLVDEELVAGADRLVRKHAKSLPCQMNISRSGKSAFCRHALHYVYCRDGWSFYVEEDGEEVGLCPNFAHYYPEPPVVLYVGFFEVR